MLDGLGVYPYRGVGVDDDLTREVPARRVLGSCLAAPLRQLQQLDAAVAEARDDLMRPVRGRVRDHEDLAPIGRIVEREDAFEGAGDDVRLVVDGKGDADPRPAGRGSPRARPGAVSAVSGWRDSRNRRTGKSPAPVREGPEATP